MKTFIAILLIINALLSATVLIDTRSDRWGLVVIQRDMDQRLERMEKFFNIRAWELDQEKKAAKK